MSHTRTPQQNRQDLLDAQNTKMSKRKRKNSSDYRQSRLNADLFLEQDEAILHITGNDHHRTIFVENYNRTFQRIAFCAHPSRPDAFQFKATDIDTLTEKKEYRKRGFNIFAVREEYRKMGFHYFSYCKPKNDITSFTNKLTKNEIPFNEIDSSINQTLAKIANLKDNNTLSLFAPENAKQISSAKTNYDLWLEELLKPLTNDFEDVTDEKARKFLQLLKCYLAGGSFKRALSFHAYRHHCDAVLNVIKPYEEIIPLQSSEPAVETFLQRKRVRPNKLIEIDLIDEENKPFIPLEESLYSATVESIIVDLITVISASKEKQLNKNGDLFSIIEVVKDVNDVDSSELKEKFTDSLLQIQTRPGQ